VSACATDLSACNQFAGFPNKFEASSSTGFS
jgi:hypothetical protein